MDSPNPGFGWSPLNVTRALCQSERVTMTFVSEGTVIRVRNEFVLSCIDGLK